MRNHRLSRTRHPLTINATAHPAPVTASVCAPEPILLTPSLLEVSPTTHSRGEWWWRGVQKSGFSSASSDDGALFSARDMNDEETPYRVEPSRWTHAYSSHTTWEE